MRDRKGANNPNWKGGKIQKTCITCGIIFFVAKHEESHTHCSLNCAHRDMSQNKRGLYNPSWVKYGQDNFFYGKNLAKKGNEHHSWRGAKKIYICAQCNNEFEAYQSTIHKFCSVSCRSRYLWLGKTNPSRKNKGKRLGILSPTWKGGITPIGNSIRSSDKYNEWRLMVFERDKFTCQRCNKRGCYLEAHHKIAISKLMRENNITNFESALECSELWDIKNWITLCKDCHKKTPNYANKKSISEVSLLTGS